MSHATIGKQKNGRLLNEYVNCALEFRMTVGYRSHSERSGRLASAMPPTAIHHARLRMPSNAKNASDGFNDTSVDGQPQRTPAAIAAAIHMSVFP